MSADWLVSDYEIAYDHRGVRWTNTAMKRQAFAGHPVVVFALEVKDTEHLARVPIEEDLHDVTVKALPGTPGPSEWLFERGCVKLQKRSEAGTFFIDLVGTPLNPGRDDHSEASP